MKRTCPQIALFLVAAVILGAGRNIVFPGGVSWVGDWAKKDSLVAEVRSNPTVVPPSADKNDPPFLTLDQAVAKYKDPNVIFVDAREPDEYNSGHITGAIMLPFDWFDDYWPLVEDKLPRDKEIVTYCSGAECELSLFLARHLRELGYRRVSIFFGGWQLWQNSGHPITIGDSPSGKPDTAAGQ